MFALIHNLYTFCKKRSERKITLALLGLDNAGKTTLLNTIQGEVEKDTTPTFGFNSSTLQEGKYTIEVFDLGGGKSIRGVWRKYLAEVHAIVYVVDAADAERFEEAQATMQELLDSPFVRDKPILLYANKQDLPAAAAAAEVVKSLGLSACRNSHNVFACTAKTPAGADVDARLRDGLRWLVGCVDRDFARLGPRVQAEGDEVRQEEARKKKEREERLRRQREERARVQKAEEDERAREVEKENELNDGQAPAVLVATAAADALTVSQQEPGEPLQQMKLQQQHSLQPQAPQQPQQEPQLLEGKQHKQQKEPLPPHLIHGMGLALGLPHTIESPGSKFPPPRHLVPAAPPSPSSDLRLSKLDQSRGSGAPQALAAAASSRARISSNGGVLPPVRAPTGMSLASLPQPHASTPLGVLTSGAAPVGSAGAPEDAAVLVPSSSGGWASAAPVARRSGSARSGSSGSTGGGGGGGRPASAVGTREPSGSEAGGAGDGTDDRGGGSSSGAPQGPRRLGGTSGGASNHSDRGGDDRGAGGHRGSFSRGPQSNRVVPVAAEQLLNTVTG